MSIGHLSPLVARAGVLQALSKRAHSLTCMDTYAKAIGVVVSCLVILSTENDPSPDGQELYCSATNPCRLSPCKKLCCCLCNMILVHTSRNCWLSTRLYLCVYCAATRIPWVFRFFSFRWLPFLRPFIARCRNSRTHVLLYILINKQFFFFLSI